MLKLFFVSPARVWYLYFSIKGLKDWIESLNRFNQSKVEFKASILKKFDIKLFEILTLVSFWLKLVSKEKKKWIKIKWSVDDHQTQFRLIAMVTTIILMIGQVIRNTKMISMKFLINTVFKILFSYEKIRIYFILCKSQFLE